MYFEDYSQNSIKFLLKQRIFFFNFNLRIILKLCSLANINTRRLGQHLRSKDCKSVFYLSQQLFPLLPKLWQHFYSKTLVLSFFFLVYFSPKYERSQVCISLPGTGKLPARSATAGGSTATVLSSTTATASSSTTTTKSWFSWRTISSSVLLLLGGWMLLWPDHYMLWLSFQEKVCLLISLCLWGLYNNCCDIMWLLLSFLVALIRF